jgi:hypothetical protein
VKSRVDARLRDEAAVFVFRFACEDCGHFAEGGQRCSLGYPAAPRRAAFEPAHFEPGREDAWVELCKEFELG